MYDAFRKAGFLLSGIVLLGIATGAMAAGPKAYIGNFSDSTVSVIDTATGSVVATVPVSTGPHGMAITPDGRIAYVSGDGASTVTAIDTATDKVAQTIEVGKSPHGLALTPEGGTLLVGVYGDDRVVFVDVATQKVVGTVPVAKPHTIAMRPDGKVAYVSSQEPGNFALVVVDVPGRAVLRRVALEKTPRDVEFGFDGKALYFTLAGVNAVQVLDPASDKIVAQVPTGASPHIANFYRGASAGTAVVQGPGELLLFNPETNAPLRSIAVGKQPHWEATADGKTIYVTNEGGNDVSIVDLATGKVTSVPVGKAPRKVVVQRVSAAAPAGAAKVSIANFAFAPATLAITAGESVTWSNDDGAPHGLAYKDGTKGIDVLLPGASFSRTYDKPGTFDYLCAVHPYMTGKVVVQAR
jgi:YVTN family beta-propeller protein